MPVELEKSSLMSLLLRLWRHLPVRRQRHFYLVMFLMVLSAFAEVVSLGSLLPFLGVLASPDKVYSYPAIHAVAETAGISAASQLILPFTLLFVLVAIAANAIRMSLLFVTTRLSFASGADLGIQVYRKTLYQSYSVHVDRNSSEVIAGITSKIAGVVYGGFLPALSFMSSVVMIVAVAGAVLGINATVAVISATFIGLSYLLVTRLVQKKLEINSQHIAKKQVLLMKSLQEGLGGIRDVLLDGTQEFYCKIYSDADQPLRYAQGTNQFIIGAPSIILEAVAMTVIAVVAFMMSDQRESYATALPMLGALALAAQRLLRAVQQAYAAWSGIAGSRASLADALELLDQPLQASRPRDSIVPLGFKQGISFVNIGFRYKPDSPWVFNNLDLFIPKGSRVGIVGTTGSGKSTMLDILMGLLVPEQGEIHVDGIPVTDESRDAWQHLIAHVPQQIYLADSTIAENIAFGMPRESIDMERVRTAARQAHISEFIENSPLGYETHVGERGVRLSGGQRQRIAIARALYKNAEVLVFDEATSALDGATENEVMKAIEELHNGLTIILIAHRLTTVKHCETIVELECGRIVAMGSYEYLMDTSSSFRNMAQAR